ncbi:MAG: DNA polymerase IV [Candidatus Micrarchaeota archaeon]|nr:DNA polymerase IV [Candidatus Micrarchaeota archaeon]
MVVGADPKGGKGRGVVSTASYAARKFGVKSGMPISIAYKKCPNCIFLPVDFEYYLEVSNKVLNVLRKYSKRIEVASIDEAYLDLSYAENYEKAIEITKEIKKEIKNIGLSCSIGIAPNKLIAKIASDYQKPDGLTVVRPNEVVDFIKPLNVKAIPGIGPKTSEFLKERKIETIEQLQKLGKEELKEWFGKFGEEIYDFARGVDDSELITEYSPKSFSREHTFEVDTKNIELMYEIISIFAEELENECKKENKKFKTVTLKIRFEDFETHTKSKTIQYSDSKEEIKKIGIQLLNEFYPFEKRVRLIGLKVSNFSTDNEKEKRKHGRITDYFIEND